MTAFRYPEQQHERRHGPCGYAAYKSYRPWLRDEFAFRCVYCLLREQWGRTRGVFELDHFLPVAIHPEHERNYDNLLYCCASCNAAKQAKLLPDPCQVFINRDVWVHDDGTIEGRTKAARKLVRMLGLDTPESTEFRSLWLGIISLAEAYDPDLYRRLMGFPEDLPDLESLQPPGGNTRLKGVAESYAAKRKQGKLPETY
jgi:hypothetical protein